MEQPFKSNPFDLALIAIMVSRQVPRDVANKSVGEKLSPLPQWSKGASVLIRLPDCRWIASQFKFPK